MKKKLHSLLMIAVIASSVLLFNSCKEDKYYEIINPPSANWHQIDVEINPNDWTWDPAAKQYYYDYASKDLSEAMYDFGMIGAYAFFGKYDQDEVQVQLPIKNDPDGRNIDYDISYDLNKSIRFYFYWDDFAQIRPDNAVRYFRIVIVYPPN